MGKVKQPRELVEKLYATDQELKRRLVQNIEFTREELKEVRSLREKFRSVYSQLFDDSLEPLDARFHNGDEQAVDEVIDFLKVDIPAFRCGYVKEKWIRRLKSTPLTAEQKERLRRAALSLCVSPHHRRELTEWNRLMIKLANKEFVAALLKLTETSDEFVCAKAQRMAHVILNERRDVIDPRWLRTFFLHKIAEALKRRSSPAQ